ncbi:MAG: hypothetical protein LBT38_02030 [Deltaproteobacteria bacterium]|jgi:hypothetical protein|nr:hypothetical protein [Deltaproteobacteria bacterium]
MGFDLGSKFLTRKRRQARRDFDLRLQGRNLTKEPIEPTEFWDGTIITNYRPLFNVPSISQKNSLGFITLRNPFFSKGLEVFRASKLKKVVYRKKSANEPKKELGSQIMAIIPYLSETVKNRKSIAKLKKIFEARRKREVSSEEAFLG